MFDPSMLSAMGEMMKNPEMMKQMEEMMKNPEIMNNAMNMMNNSNMSNLFSDASADIIANANENANNEENNKTLNGDNLETDSSLKFKVNDELLLVNLKSESFNNQECIVKSFNKDTNRYFVYVKSLEKQISVKEENLKENCEVIIEVN